MSDWNFRAVAQTPIFELLGVAVTITPLTGAPIEATGIWESPDTDPEPSDGDLVRQEPIRSMAFRRSEVPVGAVAVGTVIEAPPQAEDAAELWVVDGPAQLEVETVRVILTRQLT